MRFLSTVELVNALEEENAQSKQGQIAHRLTYAAMVIPYELGYLPFSTSGGALLFHLLSKLFERTSVVINTNLNFSEWANVFVVGKMTTALLERLTHHCHMLKLAMTATGSRTAPHSNPHRPPRRRRRPRTYLQSERDVHEKWWVKTRWKWWVRFA